MKRNEVDIEKISPMMKQYLEIKNNYSDVLLFYRLGDFYELFFEDAILVSKICELTLTGRSSGLDEKVPMCGVPHHSVKSYIEKLINAGYKVAICEQLEDPRFTKGMVKRGVIDVISKGMISDLELLDKYSNSYIASLLEYPDIFLLTLIDISTGKLLSISLKKDNDLLINQILHYGIKEIILINNEDINLINTIQNEYQIDIDYENNYYEDIPDDINKKVNDIRVLYGIKHLFYYLKNKGLKDLEGINDISIIDLNNYLLLDEHAINNLELIKTIRSKEREYSLLWLLDKCKTAMGSRKLKDWIINPIKDINKLNDRFNKIEKLNEEFILKDELRNLLDEVYDIERLTGKLTNGSFNGRDFLQLKKSLSVLPKINEINDKLKFNYEIKTFNNLVDILDKALDENPPIGLKEGGLIKTGYNKELDELKEIRGSGKNFIASFENKIKNQTGIKNLKIGFNKVFGYYIEITKANIKDVKEEYGWERRQTLTNCERFISPELKEKEALILNAEENIIDLEYKLFNELKELCKKEIVDIRKTADELSSLDVIISLAKVADDNGFVRPKFNNNHKIEIIDGWHPVVQKVLNDTYVNNDCIMNENTDTLLITGPNMSGKSTYMRQIAITIIMAQIGSFVPCKSADLMIVDKIFTRIGASDDLVGGMSTFMVEMMEAGNALMGATENSLLIFDELGRGTATYDGISLARAILEYINDNIKCKTLFSTHYHELTILDKKFKNIKNVHVDATLDNGKLVFLHKVKNGMVDKSYGIHVAALAGLPEKLLDRADTLLNEYENKESTKKSNNSSNNIQLSLKFDSNENNDNTIIEEIKKINPLEMTPMDALNKIYELSEKINKKDV